MSKTKGKKKATDEVVVECLRCGQRHRFASLEAMGTVAMSTPWTKCGAPYLELTQRKLAEMLALLESDPGAMDIE